MLHVVDDWGNVAVEHRIRGAGSGTERDGRWSPILTIVVTEQWFLQFHRFFPAIGRRAPIPAVESGLANARRPVPLTGVGNRIDLVKCAHRGARLRESDLLSTICQR